MDQENVNEKDLLSYYRDYHTMLNHMFSADTWLPRSKANRKDLRILSLLLYCQYLTVDLMVTAQTNTNVTYESENLFVYRLVKRGLIKCDSTIQISNIRTNVYTLTQQGAIYCKEELPRFLAEQRFFKSDVDETCIDIIYHRFEELPKRRNMNHYIQLLHSVIFSFTCTGKSYYYNELEAFINANGTVLSLSSKANYTKGKEKQTVKIKSDMYMKYSYANNDTELFIEQDMFTQRINILISKMESYCKYVFNNCNGRSTQCLVFSLFKPYEITNANTLPLHISHVRCALACAMQSDEFKESKYTLENFPLENVLTILRNDIDHIHSSSYLKEYDKFFMTTEKIIKRLIEDGGITTINEMVWALRDRNADRRLKVHNMMQDQLLTGYNNRKRAIFSAAIESDIIRTHLKQGYSICTIPAKYTNQYMPYISHGMGIWDNGIRFIEGDNPFIADNDVMTSYEAMSTTLQEDGYVIKNHFVYENGMHIYVENISEDLGGYVRVQEYMKWLHFTGNKGLLLCVVMDENGALLQARQLWKDSNYAKSYKSKTLPLNVVFIKPCKDVSKQGLFELPFIFDEDGNEIKLA